MTVVVVLTLIALILVGVWFEIRSGDLRQKRREQWLEDHADLFKCPSCGAKDPRDWSGDVCTPCYRAGFRAPGYK